MEHRRQIQPDLRHHARTLPWPPGSQGDRSIADRGGLPRRRNPIEDRMYSPVTLTARARVRPELHQKDSSRQGVSTRPARRRQRRRMSGHVPAGASRRKPVQPYASVTDDWRTSFGSHHFNCHEDHAAFRDATSHEGPCGVWRADRRRRSSTPPDDVGCDVASYFA